jgi:DNA polymerase III delta prime subunit
MTVKINSLWAEKYRPTTLKTYMGEKTIKDKFQSFIDNQDIPHIGLFGMQGLGKSTLAKILISSIECDYLHINAADERGIEVIREKVGSFASSNSFKPLKIVVLEESTLILQASQVILLDMMERFSFKTRFILTGNYPERLIPALRSRLQEFKLDPLEKKASAKYIISILEKENIQYNLEDVAKVINNSYPDFRKIINNLQKFSTNGILTVSSNFGGGGDFMKEILMELKKPTDSKAFNNVRQIMANNNISLFDDAFRYLYDNSSLYSKGNDGQVAYIINEHMYQSNFKIDQEINFMSCISRILELIK